MKALRRRAARNMKGGGGGVSLTAPSFRASTLTASPQFIAIGPEVCNTTTRTATSLRIQAERQGKNKEHRPISRNFTATNFAWVCVVVHVHEVCKRVVLHETGETSFKTADEGNQRWLWICTWWIWSKRWCGNSWWCMGKNMLRRCWRSRRSLVLGSMPQWLLCRAGRFWAYLLALKDKEASVLVLRELSESCRDYLFFTRLAMINSYWGRGIIRPFEMVAGKNIRLALMLKVATTALV